MVCCCDCDNDDDDEKGKDGRERNFRGDRCGEVEKGTLELLHRCVRGGGRWCRNAVTHNVDADNAVGGRHHKCRGHNAELKIMILDVVVLIVLVVVVMVDDITKNKNKNNDDDENNNGTMVLILAISRWTTN